MKIGGENEPTTSGWRIRWKVKNNFPEDFPLGEWKKNEQGGKWEIAEETAEGEIKWTKTGKGRENEEEEGKRSSNGLYEGRWTNWDIRRVEQLHLENN